MFVSYYFRRFIVFIHIVFSLNIKIKMNNDDDYITAKHVIITIQDVFHFLLKYK